MYVIIKASQFRREKEARDAVGRAEGKVEEREAGVLWPLGYLTAEIKLRMNYLTNSKQKEPMEREETWRINA